MSLTDCVIAPHNDGAQAKTVEEFEKSSGRMDCFLTKHNIWIEFLPSKVPTLLFAAGSLLGKVDVVLLRLFPKCVRWHLVSLDLSLTWDSRSC